MDDSSTGDIVLIDRLASFLREDRWEWDKTGVIDLNDISNAIMNGQQEQPELYGDTWKHPPEGKKSRDWHIGRVIYFINHQDEIKDLEIDNLCADNYIFPQPIITDGNHRFLAAMWLQKEWKMQTVHCFYGGRLDLLDYLTGEINNRDFEIL